MNRFLKANNYIEINLCALNRFENQKKVLVIDNIEHYAFLHCFNGFATIKMLNQEYFLHEKDTMLIRKNQSINIVVNNGDCVLLEFDGTAIGDIISSTPFSLVSPIIHNEKTLINGFNEIFNNYHRENYLSLNSLGIFYQMLYKLMKKGKKKMGLIEINSHIEKAKMFIEQNYFQDISINDVAKFCKLTPNYLANIFAQYSNCSPKKYLTKIRMEHAKNLLLTRKYRINEISKKVGYKNQLHFSNEFKKYFGMSPLLFIKSIR